MVQVEWRWPSGRKGRKACPQRDALSFMLGLRERGATNVRTVAH